MRENNTSAWPFTEITDSEGLDIESIFGKPSNGANQENPFEVSTTVPEAAPVTVQEKIPTISSAPASVAAPATVPAAEATVDNPIADAFEQKTAEHPKTGLFEKPPVFYHKGVKEDIADASLTFEELRICKAEDFADLEEGKRVSWSVEYCGIRKEIKDPKGTTIISIKEMIERSREFLEALKKAKEKNPCCYVKPKVEMKTKGNAAYKGKFGTLEEARSSDKVICLVPSGDGQIYELRKMEQGEFIAPKNNIADFPMVRAGFTPALPKIPTTLMRKLISFFRAFMTENEENEALALIYWDKLDREYFVYVPKQTVCKDEVEASLHGCPFDNEDRYLCYADIHSHNSMGAFFSAKDDRDECSTGLYFVLGNLHEFYPSIKARIFCGDTFVDIDPDTVIEGLEEPFPQDWLQQVTIRKKKSTKYEKSAKSSYLDLFSEVEL